MGTDTLVSASRQQGISPQVLHPEQIPLFYFISIFRGMILVGTGVSVGSGVGVGVDVGSKDASLT